LEGREQSDNEEKTEEPSEERRKQFREEGKIIQPRELVSALALLTYALMLPYFAKLLFISTPQIFANSFKLMSAKNLDLNSILNALTNIMIGIAPGMSFLFLGAILIPHMVGLCFTQFLWLNKWATPDLSKLNPVQGFGRLLGLQNLKESGKFILKSLIFCFILYYVLKSSIPKATTLYMMAPKSALIQIGIFTQSILLLISMGAIGFAIIDYFFQWQEIENQLKMTKQEVKEEHKQHEGNPQVKSQRRRFARELVMKVSVEKVKQASFIVTNPDHFAVAIRYHQGMPAPIVVAKGQDFLALRIKEIAKTNNIIIVENKPLARTLYKTTKIGKEIPPSLYSAVIEVMKYIYKIRGPEYFNKNAQ
jgi:flagellar biosynthetic protein FlhB